MTDEKEAITVQDLRRILFNIHNQEMTVKELRDALYQIDDQRATVEEFDSFWKLGINKQD